MVRPTRLCFLAVSLLLWVLPASALTQGVESSPTGVEDMLPAKASKKSQKNKHARGWLGVLLEAGEDHQGVEVTKVLRGSPAKSGGIKSGDRILSVDGEAVTSTADVQRRVRKRRATDKAQLVISRNGKQHSLAVALGEAPPTQDLLERQFVGHRAPQFTARTVGEEARTVSLDQLEGKPVVVDFWATWCGPCIPLSQSLGKLSDEFDDRAHFIGLTSESKEAVEQHLARHSSKFDVATIGEDVMGTYLIESYPTVFVIDARGKVRGVFIGLGHDDEINELLEKLTDS